MTQPERPMHARTVKREKFSPILQALAARLLKLLGWELAGDPPAYPKMVCIGAPHVSNWDLLWTLLAAVAYGTPAVFMVKDTVFWWPLGPFMYWLGGVPVNRRKRTSAVSQMAEVMRESDMLRLVISPQGTRKGAQWKTGFYWIAHEAGAPLVLGYINARKRIVGVSGPITVSGDLEADWPQIQAFYQEKADYTPVRREERQSDAPEDTQKPSPEQ